jgi:hypothetical protein
LDSNAARYHHQILLRLAFDANRRLELPRHSGM